MTESPMNNGWIRTLQLTHLLLPAKLLKRLTQLLSEVKSLINHIYVGICPRAERVVVLW